MEDWWNALASPRTGISTLTSVGRQAAYKLAFHPRGWWLATRLGLHRIANEESSWGYRLVDLSPAQAAVGLAMLPRLPLINWQRRRRAEEMLGALQGVATLRPLAAAAESDSIYLRLPLLAESESHREAWFRRFWAAGVGAGRMYPATLPTLFPPLAGRPFPGAESLARQLLTLPTNHHVGDADMALIRDILFCA
jgi:dTDP-4-amino-4,6-dideoxygalactose transaminase